MEDQFSRLEFILGKEALEILSNCTVLVLGLGGVGSFAAEALARSNIGHLVLVDKDVVDITNVNRQIHALNSTVGEFKTVLMEQRIKNINPSCKVTALPIFYNEETNDEIFNYNFDYVVDAIDTMNSKINIIVECKRRSIPIISSMGTANKMDPTQLIVTDISKTHMDPVARIIRQGLKKRGINSGIKVVFSPEKPVQIKKGASEMKGFVGSNAFVPPTAGLIMASVVIRELTIN